MDARISGGLGMAYQTKGTVPEDPREAVEFAVGELEAMAAELEKPLPDFAKIRRRAADLVSKYGPSFINNLVANLVSRMLGF